MSSCLFLSTSIQLQAQSYCNQYMSILTYQWLQLTHSNRWCTKTTETHKKHTACNLSLFIYAVLGKAKQEKLPEISTYQEDRHRGICWLYQDTLHCSHRDYLGTHRYLLHSEHLWNLFKKKRSKKRWLQALESALKSTTASCTSAESLSLVSLQVCSLDRIYEVRIYTRGWKRMLTV